MVGQDTGQETPHRGEPAFLLAEHSGADTGGKHGDLTV
jgi:hypothetical protein